MRASVVAVGGLLLISSTLAFPSIPASHTTSPLGSVVVRVAISDITTSDMERDWVINGNFSAGANGPSACHAEASSLHGRFYTPRFIDFTLWFNGTSETDPCVDATYNLTLYAFHHDFDSLYDLDGTAPMVTPPAPCSTQAGPSRDQAALCQAVIPFNLSDDPKTGTLDGAADNIPNEDDMALSYRIEVAASTFSIDEVNAPAPAWEPWLVRVDILNFTVETTGDLTDWFLEGTLNNSMGQCAAEGRTTHSRFIPATHLEFLIRHGNDCGDQAATLMLVAYEHATDSYLDLNGTAGQDECPSTTPGRAQDLRYCQLVVDFDLAEGSFSNSSDGNADQKPADKDVHFDYRVTITDDPATDTGHMAFLLAPADPDSDVYKDWLIDGQALGAGGCVSEGRTFHARFVEPRSFDFVFRNNTDCLNSALTITLFAYAHATDGFLDINATTLLNRGAACPTTASPPASLARGCRLVFAWDPSSFYDRVENGAADGFGDANDAAISLTLKRFV